MVAIPFFVFVNYFMFFVRNDNDPILATVATVVGGVFNVFGDIFFVFDFGLGMGIKGAGLATAIGQALTIVILCTHFFKKTNTLKFEKISNISNKIFNILKIGISAFILDVCMGVVVVIFNNQINLYTSNNASILGIYGVICNMQTLVQGFAYSVGQANQPLLSAEYGKNNKDSIKELHRYGLISSLIIGLIFLLVFMMLPNVIISSFINTKLNPEVIDIGPKYLRMYFATVPILAINVYLTYYYQSVQKAEKSFITSICRGFIFPLIFLFILPIIKFDLIFLAIPLGEIIVFIMNIFFQKTPLKIENNLKLL